MAEKVVLGEAVWFGYVLGLIGLVAITTGTLYQKRFCAAFDLRTRWRSRTPSVVW